VVIGRGVRLKQVIVDGGCVLPDSFNAGLYLDEDWKRFHVTERSITLITLITPEMLGQPVCRVG